MKENIILIVEKLKQAFPEARFIVFGSQATGLATQESDLDLCVVFPVLTKDPFDLIYDIRVEARKYLKIAMDIIVVSDSSYAERSRQLGSLEYIVETEGIAV